MHVYLYRICLDAPVIVEIPDHLRPGGFRRVFGRVRDMFGVDVEVGTIVITVCFRIPTLNFLS